MNKETEFLSRKVKVCFLTLTFSPDQNSREFMAHKLQIFFSITNYLQTSDRLKFRFRYRFWPEFRFWDAFRFPLWDAFRFPLWYAVFRLRYWFRQNRFFGFRFRFQFRFRFRSITTTDVNWWACRQQQFSSARYWILS